MVLTSLAQAQRQAALPISFPDDLLLLAAGVVCAFVLSALCILSIMYLYRKSGWIRPVEPGRTPDPRARLGGVGIYLAFLIASLAFYIGGSRVIRLNTAEETMYWLFLAAATLTVIVNAYDDLKPMKPLPKLIAQIVAVAIVLGPFVDGMFHGVLLFGFSNPFQTTAFNAPWYEQSIIHLFITAPVISLAAIPAVLVTLFWMVGMMNTVNWIDGVDGLAGGVVAISGLFITITSWLLGQYSIALLSGIFTGATLGFLLLNWKPAKILMGDSGSQFLGLGLAVLSIIGGAKVALALMVVGIPILNMAIVIINRVRRGQSPMHYDTTQLHDRLRASGLTTQQICYVFYGFTALFGVLALRFEHFYKLIGIGLVVITMGLLIAWIDFRQRQADLPPPPDPDGANPSKSQQAPSSQAQEPGGAVPSTPPETPPVNQPQRGSSGEHFPAQMHP